MSSEGFSETRVQGFVKNQNGEPLSDILVESRETGDSAVTDATGSFVLTTTLPAEPLRLFVSNPEVEASVTLPALQADTGSISLSLRLDLSNGELSIVSIDIADTVPPSLNPEPGATPLPADDRRHYTVYQGSVSGTGGRLLSDVRVIVVNTGAADVTDQSGQFRIRTRSLEEDTLLKLVLGPRKFNLRIQNIPHDRDLTVTLTLVLLETKRRNGSDPDAPEEYDRARLASIEIEE